jgi:hypothetical protein
MRWKNCESKSQQIYRGGSQQLQVYFCAMCVIGFAELEYIHLVSVRITRGVIQKNILIRREIPVAKTESGKYNAMFERRP